MNPKREIKVPMPALTRVELLAGKSLVFEFGSYVTWNESTSAEIGGALLVRIGSLMAEIEELKRIITGWGA